MRSTVLAAATALALALGTVPGMAAAHGNGRHIDVGGHHAAGGGRSSAVAHAGVRHMADPARTGRQSTLDGGRQPDHATRNGTIEYQCPSILADPAGHPGEAAYCRGQY